MEAMTDTDSEPLVSTWQEVGDPPPAELGPGRVVLREIAAIVQAVESAPLEWRDEAQALASGLCAHDREPFRAGVRPGDAALVLLDREDSVLAVHPLEGSSLDEAVAWLREQLSKRDIPAELPAPGYREVIDTAHRPSLTELGRWIGNADRLLRNLSRHTEKASPPRFDAESGEHCTRFSLPARAGEPARDVAVGLSCGDASVAEPYFFARPRPVDVETPLPTLPRGARWVREPAIEAVMPCSSVASDRSPSAQADRVATFIEAAVPAAHDLVHRAWARK